MRDHPSRPVSSARRLALALPLVLILGVALLPAAGCRQDAQDGLSGDFGAGSGGPDGAAAGTQTLALSKLDGSPLGSLDYWSSNFEAIPRSPPETLPAGLQDRSRGISLGFERIVGRIDTPCRFRAALLARDRGFDILASGDRGNSRQLEFYQVNVFGDGLWTNFYCVSPRDNVGVMISASADAPDKLAFLEVHFILNSIRP